MNNVTRLRIEFIPETQVAPELNLRIDALDHLAFSNPDQEHDDPELKSIEWSSHDWMALGWMNDELASQLCLLKRKILVGEENVWVAGVGGVATHPRWQKQGFASQLMRATEMYLCNEIRVPFGLLVCADETRPFYEGNGWKPVANELEFVQNNKTRTLKTCVMILPLSDQPWPPGKINLRGLPW
jgi:nodulation protein A